MAQLPNSMSAHSGSQPQLQTTAGSQSRFGTTLQRSLSGKAIASVSAAAPARQRQQRWLTLPPQSSSEQGTGAPVAALSQDADAEERRDEYNRRMQQQMGWEDANPYEYHYGA